MHDPTADGADVEAFVAKWRGAWPEWAMVENFLPAARRPLVDAWQALQFEWQEAAWGGADARPGEAKLAWWIEELDGWAKGRRRHPLGAVLLRGAAPWREVAVALPALLATRERPLSPDSAWSALDPVAGAVAQVDAALFGGQADAAAVTACWLHARLARHPENALPPSAGGEDAAQARRLAATALLARWPRTRGVGAPRGIALALARRRLVRGDAAAPLTPWSALWAGWRGARG
ncbi:phytoene/squalene synthase family protein [Cognatilysobacter segetis]|uniref:phytoene/squalene synthase family protein n=1 Tax=Cognatilysobacter segetis TaxID=2492394 RepID=UPI0010603230|nr:phytoene/squalene synthase family protein [Lysobacter segetis]